MSVTPQTNEPEAPGTSPADEADPADLTERLFPRPPSSRATPASPASPDESAAPDVARLPDPPPSSAPAGDEAERLDQRAPAVSSAHDGGEPVQLEARLVTRLVRHVSPWSVLKVSALLYLSMYVVLLLAGIGLWMIAANRGLVGSFETFMDELLAEENFRVHGDQVLRVAAAAGILGVVVAASLTVLFSIMFNLISDITGGVRFSVVEMETARPRRRRGRL